MSHNIFSSLWSNFVLFFLLKLSVFPFPINFCWVNKTCIWSVPTALYYCNSKKIQFSFQLAQISTEAVSQPTMQPGSKAGQSQGSWFCLIVDLYLKWSLVVSDPILKNENVAEQFLLIGAIDFNGWSHIDQSGTFFYQTMITIAIGDQRNARFDPELKLLNSYKEKAKLKISWHSEF